MKHATTNITQEKQNMSQLYCDITDACYLLPTWFGITFPSPSLHIPTYVCMYVHAHVLLQVTSASYQAATFSDFYSVLQLTSHRGDEFSYTQCTKVHFVNVAIQGSRNCVFYVAMHLQAGVVAHIKLPYRMHQTVSFPGCQME